MTQVTVCVTEEHILYGEKALCRYCPLALAINSVLHSDYTAVVGDDKIVIEEDDSFTILFTMLMEPKLIKFVTDFDDDKRVYPFSFEIDAPEEILA